MGYLEDSVDIVTLANTLIKDSSGNSIKMGHLWAKQNVVLVFLRHFACIACRAHAIQVWTGREKYEKSGAKLIFIGNGSPDYIEHFRKELQLDPAVVLTDPSLQSFYAAGFKRGFFRIVQPHSVINAAKLALKGFKQAAYTKEAGTHWQLGGVLAISTNGKVLYHFISHSLGDFPPESDIEEISAALG